MNFYFVIYAYIFFTFFFNLSIIFFNEEFLIGLNLVLFFLVLFSALKKIIKFLFFYKIEYIYFSFLYLIKVYIFLSTSVVKLVNFYYIQNNYFFFLHLYKFFFFNFDFFFTMIKLKLY